MRGVAVGLSIALSLAVCTILAGCYGGSDTPAGEPPTVTLEATPTSLPGSQGHVEFVWHTTGATDIVSTTFGVAGGPLGTSSDGRAVKWVTIPAASQDFSITVRGADGQTATDSATVAVRGDGVNTAPYARFANPVSSANIEGTVFHFDTSETWDVEDAPAQLVMRFDWTGDGVFDTDWTPLAAADHTFSAVEARACPPVPVMPPASPQENYRATVTMEVRDTGGATGTRVQELTLVILSGNTAPTAQFTVIDPNGTFPGGAVDASASHDTETAADDLMVRWNWDWTGEDGMDTDWSTNKAATPPAYPHSGTFTIKLEVMDSGGMVNWTTRQIVVP